MPAALKKKQVLLALALSFALTSCDLPFGLKHEAREDISNLMRDPKSAEFRNLQVIDRGAVKDVCGEVNGKNAYGAYTGFRRFLWHGNGFSPLLENEDREAGQIKARLISIACSQN